MKRIAFAIPRPQGPPPGIGIVGAGGIVESCHLPAYRKADFPVAAIFDRDAVRAKAMSKRFAIPHAAATLDAMLADPAVAIVDIAVPPQAMPEIAACAAAAGKHLLCQKPLGLDVAGAADIADIVAAHGVKGAVNQQLRYAPAIAEAARRVGAGRIGRLREMVFDIAVRTPWESWPFWHGVADFELYGHSIHYLDAIRHLLGEPERVFATTAMVPGRDLPGPIRTHAVLLYPDDRRAWIAVDHDAPTDVRADVRLSGDAGQLLGELGALFDYPRGRPDRLQQVGGQCDEPLALAGRWFSDAFAATMGELMCAIEADREPANSIADGVKTIALVATVAASARNGRIMRLDEFKSASTRG